MNEANGTKKTYTRQRKQQYIRWSSGGEKVFISHTPDRDCAKNVWRAQATEQQGERKSKQLK